MVGATHYVIKPYLCYPTLMDSAVAVLRAGNNMPWSLRLEVLRTIGILGALDPFKYQQIQLYLRAERLQQESITSAVDTPDNEDDNSSQSSSAGRRASIHGSIARISKSITPSLGGGADGNEGAIAVAAAAISNTHNVTGSTETFLQDLGLNGIALSPGQLGVALGSGHGLLDDDTPPLPKALLNQIQDGSQVCIH